MNTRLEKPSHDAVADHIASMRERYAAALKDSKYDGIIIANGIAPLYFNDDQGPRFRANPQLMQWAPVAEHPGSCLLYRPGADPVLAIVSDDDYWHRPPEPPSAPWADSVEIRVCKKVDDIRDGLGALPESLALLGPEEHFGAAKLKGELNPPSLVNHLDFQRAVKTDWEVACVRVATSIAAAGHRSARERLAGAGATEFDVFMAFLLGCRQTADELPYPAIVAGDAHAATLHYQHYERDNQLRYGLLIDAGCDHFGYASDITRTYSTGAESLFDELINAVDDLQQALCDQVTPGIAFADLHRAAHRGIAEILSTLDLVAAPPEDILAENVTAAFFPHGLGHLLGLQVHDVGGHLGGPNGEALEPPDDLPRLRLLRPLSPGTIVTIEPGLYFIDTLLAGLRENSLADQVNWERIDRLRPCGGVRVEDDVLVTTTGHENLTRRVLPD